MNTRELRKQLRAQRLALSADIQARACAEICERALRLDRYRLSTHIAFYLATQGEIDPASLLQAAHQVGKQCYLPVLHPHKIGCLCFLPYQPGDPLSANRFGILEPIYDAQRIFPTWHLDLVFTPLVAFDHKKNRLGMGQGYYDRTFEFVKHASKPYLVGLAYAFQEVGLLQAQAHDVALDEVITV